MGSYYNKQSERVIISEIATASDKSVSATVVTRDDLHLAPRFTRGRVAETD